MKRTLPIPFLLGVTILLLMGSVAAGAYASSPAGHPEMSKQEKLIPCQQCHQQTTPGVHREWYQSKHGIAMVKCYQCHGTFEESFRATPEISSCDACHHKMVEKCPKDKPCWGCHTPHLFSGPDQQ